MSVELLQARRSPVQSRTDATPLEDGPPAGSADHLAWAEVQRRAWMEVAQDALARVEQLEQACVFLRAEADAGARQLQDKDRALAEQRQRLEALQRCLDDLRGRLAAAETSPGRLVL